MIVLLFAVPVGLGSRVSGLASFLAQLAPLGIFAISAAAAGTIDPEDLGRLETKGEKVFLISATVICYACATILFMQACCKKLLDSLLMGLPNNTIQGWFYGQVHILVSTISVSLAWYDYFSSGTPSGKE
jgi:hypothetical protein